MTSSTLAPTGLCQALVPSPTSHPSISDVLIAHSHCLSARTTRLGHLYTISK